MDTLLYRYRTNRIGLMAGAGSLLAMLLAGCGGGGSSSDVEVSPLQTSRQYNSLRLTLSQTKTTYSSGEAIPFTFTLKNTGSKSITLTTPGGPSQPGDPITAGVLQSDTLLWNKNDGLGGGAVVTPFSIAPGETRTHTFTWNQKPNRIGNPDTPVPAGTYVVRAYPYLSLEGVNIREAETKLLPPDLSFTIQ